MCRLVCIFKFVLCCHAPQVTLTANHEKMDGEVNSLRFQLENEKSRYRKMQNDLQKELNVAFDENTKLTSLLDGKVPKSMFPLKFFVLFCECRHPVCSAVKCDMLCLQI